MADVTTTTYQFVLPEVGASDDTWGGKNNNDWAKVEALLLSGFTAGSPTDIGKLKGDHLPTNSTLALTASPALTISNATVQEQYFETDQAMPAGAWRMILSGDSYNIRRNTHATTPFSTEEVALQLVGSTKRVDIPVYGLTVGGTGALALNANDANIRTYRSGNHWRLKEANNASGIGVLHRADSTYYQVMLTADGDADGTYNTLRPFFINKTTGRVGMNQGINVLSGISILDGGLSFGSLIAATSFDLANHISLYGSVYGLSVTANQQNYVAPAAAAHVFYLGTTGGTRSATIELAGPTAGGSSTVITREKGDNRYAQLGANEFTAAQTIKSNSTVGWNIVNSAGAERMNLFQTGTASVWRNQNATGGTVSAISLAADGAVTVSGQLIGDGSGLTALSTAAVGAALGPMAYNAVGSSGVLARLASGTASPGQNVSGSSLNFSNAGGTGSGGALSGTWECLGASTGGANDERTLTWRRIN